MSGRLGARAQAAVVAVLVGLIVAVGGLAPSARAAADPSDVVIVLDFSASILRDEANRNRFGAALERIAQRVDDISADLVAGDVTVSIVQFATRAADYPSCVDLKLLGNAGRVGHFADCLRSVAGAYRKGVTPALTKKIGTDTNYVEAMERAAAHLPSNAVRPALILFTDGKHDVPGVPVSRVQPTRDRLFGSRQHFALLPVGMGLAAGQRPVLTAGLENLRVIRDMPACVSGATFDWPTVVFETPAAAGNAVGVALQEATCTFTVAPTPTPATPKPTPTPAPVPILGLKLVAGDATADITWAGPITGSSAPPVTDWKARCTAADGTVVESSEGTSTERKATISGLKNGTEYRCEVAAVTGTTQGNWTPAGTVTPVGRPTAPGKPTVEPLNAAVQVGIAPVTGSTGYTVECSNDNGATWTAKADTSAGTTTTVIGPLTNGASYVCRTFAENAIGVSEASPVSDAVKPCNSLFECNSTMLPVFGGLAFLLFGGIILALIALIRGRTTGYVIAVVDVVHTANIGSGSSLGLSFVRAPGTRQITGIVADRGPKPDVRIRRPRGGGFVVRDQAGKREVPDGDPITVTDGHGGRHSLVLRAFDTNAASRVATRR